MFLVRDFVRKTALHCYLLLANIHTMNNLQRPLYWKSKRPESILLTTDTMLLNVCKSNFIWFAQSVKMKIVWIYYEFKFQYYMHLSSTHRQTNKYKQFIKFINIYIYLAIAFIEIDRQSDVSMVLLLSKLKKKENGNWSIFLIRNYQRNQHISRVLVESLISITFF